MSVPPEMTEDSTARAAAAVDALLQDPDREQDFEPTNAESARAAIERFAARFASADGWVKAVVEGAHAGAQGLSGDRLQGLAEIVQNADDAGASGMRIMLDTDALLVAHDGRPVTLSDVFALATPWVTTKSANASATGRFGLGLMTLQSLSSVLEVYSGSLAQARVVINDWKEDYNHRRRHSALGYQAPAVYAAARTTHDRLSLTAAPMSRASGRRWRLHTAGARWAGRSGSLPRLGRP